MWPARRVVAVEAIASTPGAGHAPDTASVSRSNMTGGFFLVKIISPVSLVAPYTYQAPDAVVSWGKEPRSLVVVTNRLSCPLPSWDTPGRGLWSPGPGESLSGGDAAASRTWRDTRP